MTTIKNTDKGLGCKKVMKLNLPNRISLSRIALIPIFMAVYMLDRHIAYAQLIGAVLFSIIMATDAVDGTIARRRNMVTSLGKFLDSIADKSLVTAGLFMIVYQNQRADIGLGSAVIICATIITIREFLISFLRQVAADHNYVMHADRFGKVKAVFQDVSIPLLLAAKDLKRLFGMDSDIIEYVAFALFAVATLLTVLSAISYFIKHGHYFSEESATVSAQDAANARPSEEN